MAYTILIGHGNDPASFSSELSYCNGANLALITARQCDIPLTILRAPPFNLVLG